MNDSLMMTPHHTSTSSPSEGLNSNRSGLMSPGDIIIPFKCFTPSLFSPGGQTVVPEEDESHSVNGMAQSNFEADREMNDSINSEGVVSKGKDTSGAHAVTSPLQFIQTRTSDAQENMDEVVSHDSDEERGDGDGMIQSIDDIGSTSNVDASSDSAEEHVSLNIPKAVDILNGTENVSMMNDSLMMTPHHTSTSSPSEGLNSNRSGLMSPGDTIIPFKCFWTSLFSPGGQTAVPEEDESNSVNGI